MNARPVSSSLDDINTHQICSTELSQFIKGKLLGKGSFGRVYLTANPLNASEKYALKSIKSPNQAFSSLLSREIHNQQSISSPFVAKLYCTFTSRSSMYLLMEYVSGGDLFDLLAKRNYQPFDKATLKRYISQIVKGVKDIHDKNIAHRDLKLENILVDSNGNLKITDFGLSIKFNIEDEKAAANHDSSRLCRTLSVCGSKEYLAPEINLVSGSSYDAKKADIWSLGIIIYLLVFAEYPDFENGQPDRYLRFLKKRPELKSLIQTILVRDPLLRPSIDTVMSHPFFENVDWEPNALTSQLKRDNKRNKFFTSCIRGIFSCVSN